MNTILIFQLNIINYNNIYNTTIIFCIRRNEVYNITYFYSDILFIQAKFVDNDDDEIGLILENSKEWEKVYQTSTTRINYFGTYTCENTEQCFQEFEKNLQKHPDKVKDLGNGGFVALINDMEKVKIYQYGRRYGSLGQDHTEPDLLSILEKIKMQKGYILISSYYAACHRVLRK